MSNSSKSFIDRRVTICMLLVAMTLLGYFSYKQLPVELLPNTELPQLYITANSRSDLTPAYMEQQVVIPLEGAISAVGGEYGVNCIRPTGFHKG